MTLATRNGAIIVKDGQLAEDCACCGGWYCYIDPSATCCETIPSIALSMNFSASPQLGDPGFGVPVQAAFASAFPKQITKTVSLAKSASKPQGYLARYVFQSQAFNELGFGEVFFLATVDVRQASECEYEATVTDLLMTWKWNEATQQLSAGDPATEPAGYQYGELVFQYQSVGLVDQSRIMKTMFSINEAQGFATTTLSVNGKTITGRGSATGTITLASNSV